MPGPGPKEWPDWPFCSARCRLIDLGRWLGESYRVPDTPIPDDSDEVPNSAAPSAVPHREEA
jgi:endogenous inhibitor of DNA gyrase (YacG/DUF329 family)